ncbi:MAG: hypothetical protein IJW83_02070 [Clostridia bacterium]|nr:hypothetical protein [Clostridia bacterium]
MLENSQWIWPSATAAPDSYADFRDTLIYRGDPSVTLFVSADSDYVCFVNGTLAACGQYGDFEHYKIYDTVEIAHLLHDGENEITFTVHYVGVATSRYYPARAGLLFAVCAADTSLLVSSEATRSRISPTYQSGQCRFVSTQLGFTFTYDATGATDEGFGPSVCVDKACRLYPRPIPRHDLLPPVPMARVEQKSDTHLLVDLGGEVVGLPTMSFDSPCEQTVTVAWGEHILDGGVRRCIGDRHFYFTYRARRGTNTFTEYMLRLGCRYLELWCDEPITLSYLGIRPQVYAVKEVSARPSDPLDRQIYDVCLHTLRLCMMEHYVDCPWREQALYTFDSRNQMLCGYYAFTDKNAAYARANLRLIGMDRRDDGLLSICYPCGRDLAIPSFSLYYFLSLREYVEHTRDVRLARELLPKLASILDAFLARRDERGLVPTFPGVNMWNFYDWSPYAEGTLYEEQSVTLDAVLNILLCMALDAFEYLCASVREPFPYIGRSNDIKSSIKQTFLCKNGYFTMHEGKEEHTALANALAVVGGIVQGNEARHICDALARGVLIDCSLSMRIFVYQALLMTDKTGYADAMLSSIRTTYRPMSEASSDTVWETAAGADDFDGAGSLCHGWSAVPIYVYHALGLVTDPNE